MAKLIYSAITSLDRYVADEEGNFDWAAPDEEVHGFVNDLERTAGTYLYGRRMYETMVFWETAHTLAVAIPSDLLDNPGQRFLLLPECRASGEIKKSRLVKTVRNSQLSGQATTTGSSGKVCWKTRVSRSKPYPAHHLLQCV